MLGYAREGKTRSKLREAILAGFDPASLDEVLRDNDMLASNVAIGPDFATRVNSLIDVARQEGWLIELCGVLAEARPDNQRVNSAIVAAQKWLIDHRGSDEVDHEAVSNVRDIARPKYTHPRPSDSCRSPTARSLTPFRARFVRDRPVISSVMRVRAFCVRLFALVVAHTGRQLSPAPDVNPCANRRGVGPPRKPLSRKKSPANLRSLACGGSLWGASRCSPGSSAKSD